MNIQFVIEGEQVYIIEVNPRAIENNSVFERKSPAFRW